MRLIEIVMLLANKAYSVAALLTASVSTIATAIRGQFNVIVMGNTDTNIVTNGNFANTTGWTAFRSTHAASGNVMSNTCDGNAAFGWEYQTTTCPIVNGKKVFIRIGSVRVTNANCSAINVYAACGTGSDILVATVSNPTQNQWYPITGIGAYTTQTVSVRVTLEHVYADAATASGKVMEIKQVMVIDLTTRFGAGNEPLIAACNLRYANWFDGTKSTFAGGGRVKATRKNKFDGVLEAGGIDAAGVNEVDATQIRSKNYIPILPSTAYINSNDKSYTASSVYYYNSNKVFISTAASNFATYTTPANAKYIKFKATGTDTTALIQLELGTSATAYEAYTESAAYFPASTNGLMSVALVKDEANINTRVNTQRNEKASIATTVYDSLDKTTYTNVDVIKTTAFALAKAGTVAVDGFADYWNSAGAKLVEIAAADIDNAASVGKYYWHTDKTLWIFVTPDTYADIAAARTGLGTSSLIYQLATPVLTTPLIRIIENGVAAGKFMCWGNNTSLIQEACAVVEAIPDASNTITLPTTTALTGLVACYKNTNTEANPMWVDALASASIVLATGVVTIAGADQTKKYLVAATQDTSGSTLATLSESHQT